MDEKIGIENPRVGGSIPSLATIQNKGLREIAGPFSFSVIRLSLLSPYFAQVKGGMTKDSRISGAEKATPPEGGDLRNPESL